MYKIIILIIFVFYISCDSDHVLFEKQEFVLPEPSSSTILYNSIEENLLWHIRISYDYKKTYNISGGVTFDINGDWSPTKKQICFLRGFLDNMNLQVWIMNYDGGNKKCITPDSLYCQNPSWSPDGDKILFDAKKEEENINFLYVIKSDGSYLEKVNIPILNGKVYFAYSSWAPDGDKIIFNFYYADYSDKGVGIYSFSTDSLVILKELNPYKGIDMKWSPISDEIIFTGVGNDSVRIFKMDLNTKKIIPFTNGYSRWADWSSDGKKIIYEHFNHLGDNSTIWVVNEDGSNPRQILNTGSALGGAKW